MAQVPKNLLRDWNDGETITSAEYEQALEILRVAINDNDSNILSRYTKGEVDTIINAVRGAGWTNETLMSLKAMIQTATLGQIPDGSITEKKLAFDPATQEELDTHANGVTHTPFGAATMPTVNNYAVTISPAPNTYKDGLSLSVKIGADSTGAVTLNVNNLGPKAVKKANGNAATSLKKDSIYTVRYNATTENFILQGEGASGNALASDLLLGKTASTDAGDITGTMPNKGALSFTPTNVDQDIPVGYYNGSGKVFAVPPTYKNYANGTSTSSNTTTLGFKYADGSDVGSALYTVTVAGLAFKPTTIIVMSYAGGTNGWTVYSENVDTSYTAKTVKMGSFNATNLGSNTYNLKGDVGVSVTETGFTLPFIFGNNPVKWIAFS